MRKSFTFKFLFSALFSGIMAATGFCQISIVTPGTPLTQDFNTLAQTGTTNTWTDNTTITGWYSNRVVYLADAGSSTTGGLYSYGTAASSDRALGGLSSGSASPIFGIRLINNTGATISGLTISFNGEQWRQNTTAQTLVFESQTGATSLTTGTWVPNTAFNFTSLKTGTAGALDGNAAGNFSVIAGTLTASVNDGQEIWLRWSKTGTSSPGLSIDDISITANAAISSNADLSNLTLSSGALVPTFAPAIISYTSSVPNGTASITVTPTTSNANATVTVNGNTVVSGNPSPAIPLNVGANVITTMVTAQDAVTTKTYTVTVTRAAAGVPLLTTTSALSDFGAVCINTTAGPNSFTLDGSDLDGSDIALAALPGFTYSETPGGGGSYTPTLNFSYTGTGFTGKIIYVKFNPTAVQSYSGNIVLSGGGVAGFNVSAAGSGINTSPSLTTGGSSLVTPTSGTAAGTIDVAGCGSITAYGIEYSTVTGFPNGTGIQVNGTNLVAGIFSVNLTGLAPNTRYYYKAYATNDAGATYSYGTQQAFTCLPLPVPMASQTGLSYTETFTDIANWSNFFITGTGANHFAGLSASGTGGIPNGTTLTASTLSFQPGNPGTSGGVQKGTDQVAPIPVTESIILLSTGSSPENSSAAAIDFYLDFTGVNAGTLSFDYQTFSNALGTGANDRAGSMRVYTSPDGITFTELTFASVLNFINNSPVNGAKSNIALPASLNNNANARIRFYYHNGSGGTNGSRPKISLDNLIITALATTPCVSPTAAAANLIFGTITDVSIQASFTAASPASDGYIVVMSTNNALTGNPLNGVIYNIGDNIGDGSVVANGNATTFTATGLTPLTTYYFFVFPVNSVCTGGPLYYTTTVLNGDATTIAGLPPCAAPASQPTGLTFGTTGTNSIPGSFTAATADEYLVLRSTSSTLSNNPVDATVYNTGDILGNATVVQRNVSTAFTANGLLPNTQYYFFVFSLNSQLCINGPVYNTVMSLTGSQTTQPLPPCATPSAQPTNLVLTASSTSIAGTFTGVADADAYLIVSSISPTLSASPVNNTDYVAGDNLGGGIVITNSTIPGFLATGLTTNTTYYFFVFSENRNCSGGTKYVIANPLTGNATTSNAVTTNYYFGSLHSHSDYSDGNKDNPGFTPADDYAYAKNSLCMDYLGISEHNHYSGGDPGNLLSTYHLGATQANTFTTNNPGFLALYGMEWGTISGGGHVLIYGDGMDDLWGWESGSGPWGASNNYDVYVPKSVYTSGTGLFKTVNDNIATNTFASLAHPNLTDFNNIANITYDAAADNAITATTVESGPSSSTNTTYTNPGSSMGYLWYYQTLLAKGYHLGPTIDHDNHYTTFGRTTFSRTAIIAPSLTKTSIVNALRNMHFYATQDCDSKVDFTISTQIMGSSVVDRYAPIISVNLTDATTATSSAIIRVMFGVPGSGILPVKIDSVIGNTLMFTDNNLANLSTGYYYIDITNGTSRIVTSPIWYSRNDLTVLPIKLSSFYVQKIDKSARISWTTDQENNSDYFIVERSTDGRTWNYLAKVNAAGNSSIRIDYNIYDNNPAGGLNYYRLKQVDKDARTEYSVVRTALFNVAYTVQIAPNPASDAVNVYLSKTNTKAVTVQMLDVTGKIIYETVSAQSHVRINASSMSKGLYFIKIIDADNVTTTRVLLQ